MPYMPKAEFDQILGTADVGLVFLDSCFTIANIPSRTLAHMDMGQPIVAATDSYTDYRQLIENNRIGLWCNSSDVGKMIDNMRKMTADVSFRKTCGECARRYLLSSATAEKAYWVIMKSFNEYMHRAQRQ